MAHCRFSWNPHSAASNLLCMGFTLKDVQEWLGHADIQTTANIYGHLDAKRKIDMAYALSATENKKEASEPSESASAPSLEQAS